MLHALVDAALPAAVLARVRVERQRAVGAALDAAMQLIEHSGARGGHIIAVLSGAANYGPGGVSSHDISPLARLAGKVALRVLFDVFFLPMGKDTLNA